MNCLDILGIPDRTLNYPTLPESAEEPIAFKEFVWSRNSLLLISKENMTDASSYSTIAKKILFDGSFDKWDYIRVEVVWVSRIFWLPAQTSATSVHKA